MPYSTSLINVSGRNWRISSSRNQVCIIWVNGICVLHFPNLKKFPRRIRSALDMISLVLDTIESLTYISIWSLPDWETTSLQPTKPFCGSLYNWFGYLFWFMLGFFRSWKTTNLCTFVLLFASLPGYSEFYVCLELQSNTATATGWL